MDNYRNHLEEIKKNSEENREDAKEVSLTALRQAQARNIEYQNPRVRKALGRSPDALVTDQDREFYEKLRRFEKLANDQEYQNN